MGSLIFLFLSGLSSSGGRAGDLGGYQSDGDLVRSRLGQGQVYGGSETYSEVSGYTSDNHYDRWVQEYMKPTTQKKKYPFITTLAQEH